MTHARPSSAIFCARTRSCSVTPAVASITSKATSARRMARRARFTMKNSGPNSTLPLRRIPAVSTKRYVVGALSLPGGAGRSITASIESRVVPATSLTMARWPPKMLLRRELLPTLGLPTIAILISSCSSSSSNAAMAFSYRSITSSSSLPKPYCLSRTSVSSSPSRGSCDAVTTACLAASSSFTLVPKPLMADPFLTTPSKTSSSRSAVPTPCRADTG
mmetsp:Transcript_31132/g.63234  ORF Transcript_31132/g.63234 Transcript_31132/m.63234 type:complete len:219 (-) Transcript_31132:637-1293(-)